MVVKRAKTSRSESSTAKAKPAPRAAVAGKAATGKAATGKPATGAAVKKAVVKRAAARKPAAKAAPGGVVSVVAGALDEMKAVNVAMLNVHQLTDVTDTMIIASGNSDRHVRSIADRVVEHAKRAGFRPLGVEGERDGEWVLVDLQDVIVHIMLPRVREFYRLESLWDISAARREAAARSA